VTGPAGRRKMNEARWRTQATRAGRSAGWKERRARERAERLRRLDFWTNLDPPAVPWESPDPVYGWPDPHPWDPHAWDDAAGADDEDDEWDDEDEEEEDDGR
jgi:hypothetical protein